MIIYTDLSLAIVSKQFTVWLSRICFAITFCLIFAGVCGWVRLFVEFWCHFWSVIFLAVTVLFLMMHLLMCTAWFLSIFSYSCCPCNMIINHCSIQTCCLTLSVLYHVMWFHFPFYLLCNIFCSCNAAISLVWTVLVAIHMNPVACFLFK